MSEFLWPPPDNELDLTGALPTVRPRPKRRQHGASRRDERRRGSKRSQPESFAWPPADSDLSAPDCIPESEAAVEFSPGAVRLDRGAASPPVDRMAPAPRTRQPRRIAFGFGSRRLAMLAVTPLLAFVIGAIWQTVGRWNAVPQPPRPLHSSLGDAQPAAKDIEVAPLSPTPRQADRPPAESRREPKEMANRTAAEREPEAPATPDATLAAAPATDEESQKRSRSRLDTSSPAEQPSEAPSEAVVASAAIGVGDTPDITSRRDLPELTPLVERVPPTVSRPPASAPPPPTAKSEVDASRRAPTAENASGSATAGSRDAAALEKDQEAIEQLVARYQAAFDERDANAAAAVWPSVERAALARAFADVQEQDLMLDSCDVAVEEEQATASCPGALSYVRRVGPSDPQVARHVWTFLLERHERGWLIAEVTAR